MSWSVGIDLVEPDRLEARMTANPGLADQLFTPAEQDYCRGQFHPYQHYAGRFCAKEAIVKALRIDGWDPLEIEILPGEPAPNVFLRGDVADRATRLGVKVIISLTHLPSMAAATAMAIPAPD